MSNPISFPRAAACLVALGKLCLVKSKEQTVSAKVGRPFVLHHVIIQLACDELNGTYSHKRQISGCLRLHEQGQGPEEGLAARTSPERCISGPMGVQLSSERKATKRRLSMWGARQIWHPGKKEEQQEGSAIHGSKDCKC